MSILNLAKCHFLNLIFAGFSMLNFFWDTSVACRVSMSATTYKIIQYQWFIQPDCRDAKFCVSTATLK